MIDNMESGINIYADEDYSRVEVCWVSPVNNTVGVARGVDIDTGDIVEWAVSPREMANYPSDPVQQVFYALVPYWAERERKTHETA